MHPRGRSSTAAPATRPASATAAGCGPTPPRSRSRRRAVGRPRRCRRRCPCRGSRRRRRVRPRPRRRSLPTARSSSRRSRAARAARAPASRSSRRGWPISQVEFAFLTRPVAGEIAPGMPMPTCPARRRPPRRRRPDPRSRRACRRSLPRGVSTRRRKTLRAVRVESDRLDLRAAEIDADPEVALIPAPVWLASSSSGSERSAGVSAWISATAGVPEQASAADPG